jgi:glycosyltransferase involved in cell wall biosynthesis
MGAGSFRNTPLARELAARYSGRIDVVTTLPSRYKSYSQEAKEQEVLDGLRIHRCKVPAHSGGMLDTLRTYWTYFKTARSLSKGASYDLVYASSSKLLTAFLGATIARRAKAPLYIDIRDIFVESIRDVIQGNRLQAAIFQWLVLPFIRQMERYTFETAVHVNLVSGGFKSYFEPKYGKKFSYFTNGVDEVFIEAGKAIQPTNNDPPVLLYAGNFGGGQGLDAVVPDFAQQAGDRVKIRLIGDGSTKQTLLEEIEKRALSNVEVLPPVGRDELLTAYKEADILFVHLNDLDAFKRVLPSKIFEYGALNKRVLAGVGGYCAQLLRADMEHMQLFPPCDANAMCEAFEKLVADSDQIDRKDFIRKYRRKTITEELAAEILSHARTDRAK